MAISLICMNLLHKTGSLQSTSITFSLSQETRPLYLYVLLDIPIHCNLRYSCLSLIERHSGSHCSFYQWKIHKLAGSSLAGWPFDKLSLLQTTWTFNLRDFESIMAYDLSRAIYLFRSMYLCGWRRQGFRSVGDPDLLNTNTSWNQLNPFSIDPNSNSYLWKNKHWWFLRSTLQRGEYFS